MNVCRQRHNKLKLVRSKTMIYEIDDFGTGNIDTDPSFKDPSNGDFHLNENSPCIDAGDPTDTDPDGSTRDIGARWFGEETQSEPGDCNADGIQNVLDVVYLINECILSYSNNCTCGDLNQDSEINVLDVVILVNAILEV